MQRTFTSNMVPVQTHSTYPPYARSGTKPVIRARSIIDRGRISERPCSTCVELGQDCYRWEGTFSKCAYCTSKDRRRELCHLPGCGQEGGGAEAEAEKEKEKEGRRKRRKITHNIYAPSADAASTADTIMSGTGTLVSGLTPFSAMPIPRSVRSHAPSPEPTSTTTGTFSVQTKLPTTISKNEAEAISEATLERVTALENQVSGLECKIMDLLVKLDEVSSCVSTSATATCAPQAAVVAGGASLTTSDNTLDESHARHLSNATTAPLATMARRATKEWVEGPKMPELSVVLPSAIELVTAVKVEEEEAKMSTKLKEHTVEHPEGYRPVNCSCTNNSAGGQWSLDENAVMRSETYAGAEANAFPVQGIAGRGNLF